MPLPKRELDSPDEKKPFFRVKKEEPHDAGNVKVKLELDDLKVERDLAVAEMETSELKLLEANLQKRLKTMDIERCDLLMQIKKEEEEVEEREEEVQEIKRKVKKREKKMRRLQIPAESKKGDPQKPEEQLQSYQADMSINLGMNIKSLSAIIFKIRKVIEAKDFDAPRKGKEAQCQTDGGQETDAIRVIEKVQPKKR